MLIRPTENTIQPLTYIQEVMKTDGMIHATPPIGLLPTACFLLLLTGPRWELMTISPNSTTPWSLSNNPSIRSQSNTSERLPDGASINTSSPQFVGLDDSVPSVKEGRPARLQLHSIHNELESEGISMLGYKRGWLGGIKGMGVVVVWLRYVGRWEEGLGESVFGNEVLRHCE